MRISISLARRIGQDSAWIVAIALHEGGALLLQS
jgi:hypothetical protein